MVDAVLIFPKMVIDQRFEKPAVPLSILTLATYLIEKENYNVKIIDQRIDNNWRATLEKELSENSLMVGISSLTGTQIHFGLEISKFVKERSNVPVVWGGLQATLGPLSTIEHPLVDILVVGEGEIPLFQLIRALGNKTPLSEVRGLVFKKNGKIIVNPPGDIVQLTDIPPIRFDLVDYAHYRDRLFPHIMRKEEVTFFIETSRGCVNKCAYCTRSKNPSRWRSLSPEKSVERFKLYKNKYGVRIFDLADENFFVNLKRIEKIVNLMEKENLGILWACGCRPEYVRRMDVSFLNRLEAVGCKSILFGAESGSDRVLKFINKGCTSQDMILANRKLAQTKIAPGFVSIAGFPTETVDEIKQTMKIVQTLADENRMTTNAVVKLIPIPGSVILDECVKAGYLKPQKLEDWIGIYDPLFLDKSWINKDTAEYIKRNEYYFQLITRRKSNLFFKLLYIVFSKIHKIRDKFNFYSFPFETWLYEFAKAIWLKMNRYLPSY